MAYFPMFVNIEKQNCLVVGGGAVALRKVRVLLEFGAFVTVVAPGILPQIMQLGSTDVKCCLRAFREQDLEDCVLVVAATDDTEENHAIAELAKAKRVPVNAVDQQEDCTFIFSSYVREQNLVGAISSGGNSPVITQYLKGEIAGKLTRELGQINEYMGSIRDIVKARVATESMRKQVYRRVLAKLLSDEELALPMEQLTAIIEEITDN